MEKDLSEALDDLILGRGVARGRHALEYRGRPVREEFLERLLANGFRPMTVREAPIVAGEPRHPDLRRWAATFPQRSFPKAEGALLARLDPELREQAFAPGR